MEKSTRGSDLICKVIDQVQGEIWDLNESCGLNDLIFDHLTDYKYYGYAIDGNPIRLNFPGTSDWLYMMVIPDSELDTFMELADTYPVYFVDLDCGEIHLEAKNYKQFLSKWLKNHPALSGLSDDSHIQSMPKMELLDDETIEYFLQQNIGVE